MSGIRFKCSSYNSERAVLASTKHWTILCRSLIKFSLRNGCLIHWAMSRCPWGVWHRSNTPNTLCHLYACEFISVPGFGSRFSADTAAASKWTNLNGDKWCFRSYKILECKWVDNHNQPLQIQCDNFEVSHVAWVGDKIEIFDCGTQSWHC